MWCGVGESRRWVWWWKLAVRVGSRRCVWCRDGCVGSKGCVVCGSCVGYERGNVIEERHVFRSNHISLLESYFREIELF